MPYTIEPVVMAAKDQYNFEFSNSALVLYKCMRNQMEINVVNNISGG